MKYKLKITEQSRNLTIEDYKKIYEITLNGIEIIGASNCECLPIPWDATVSFDNHHLVLDGFAQTKLPLKTYFKDIQLSVNTNSGYSYRENELVDIFEDARWEISLV